MNLKIKPEGRNYKVGKEGVPLHEILASFENELVAPIQNDRRWRVTLKDASDPYNSPWTVYEIEQKEIYADRKGEIDPLNRRVSTYDTDLDQFICSLGK